MAVRFFKPKTGEPAPPQTLTAAYRIENVSQLLRVLRADPGADRKAWGWYDGIGEVHFGISSGAREMSRAFLKAIHWESADSAIDVEGPAEDLVMAIQSENGGQAGLISSYYANRKVTGDGFFLAHPQKDDPSRLWFDYCSTDEISADQAKMPNGSSGKIRRNRSAPGYSSRSAADEELLAMDDIILARIWQPHPQYSDKADSPLKALHTVCEELDILTKALKAKITSRLATAGFLLFPSSIAELFVPPDEPTPDPSKLSEDPFIDWVLKMMTQAIADPSDASSAVPFVFKVPDDSIDLIKWIRVEAETFEVEIKQRAELIGRVLAGLDLRPEQIEGFGDSNHWSAWSSQDVHLKVDIAPEMESLCWALTTSYLWPQMRALRDAGELDMRFTWTEDEIRRYWVWYDLRELTVRPNKADSYGQLADRGQISGRALRSATGATEEEAPDNDEYFRMFGYKHGDAYLMSFGLPEQDEIDWDKVASKTGPGPDPASPAAPSPSGPGTKQPGGPGDSRSDRPRSKQPQ